MTRYRITCGCCFANVVNGLAIRFTLYCARSDEYQCSGCRRVSVRCLLCWCTGAVYDVESWTVLWLPGGSNYSCL
jgi:hypothetical protein